MGTLSWDQFAKEAEALNGENDERRTEQATTVRRLPVNNVDEPKESEIATILKKKNLTDLKKLCDFQQWDTGKLKKKDDYVAYIETILIANDISPDEVEEFFNIPDEEETAEIVEEPKQERGGSNLKETFKDEPNERQSQTRAMTTIIAPSVPAVADIMAGNGKVVVYGDSTVNISLPIKYFSYGLKDYLYIIGDKDKRKIEFQNGLVFLGIIHKYRTYQTKDGNSYKIVCYMGNRFGPCEDCAYRTDYSKCRAKMATFFMNPEDPDFLYMHVYKGEGMRNAGTLTRPGVYDIAPVQLSNDQGEWKVPRFSFIGPVQGVKEEDIVRVLAIAQMKQNDTMTDGNITYGEE